MSAESDLYDCANSAKAKFEDIYNAPDPRAYYSTLQRLDYQIPTNAKPVFKKLIDRMNTPNPGILDVGCSYGVNAAMLRYNMTFDELAARYTTEDMIEKSVAGTVMADAEIFADLPEETGAKFIGLDVAEEAAGYADAVGLLEEAIVEDLETDPLSSASAKMIADTNLVITTGAVGYVGAETFSKIVNASDGEPPWIGAFVLRQFPFDAIADALEEFGLVTERLPEKTFLQRRFRDDEERDGTIDAVRAAGRDPEGLETEGFYHAEFYLVRPRKRIDAAITDMGLI